MQKILKKTIMFGFLLSLSGCVGAMPEYKSSKSEFIIFKTPKIKYADQGFVSKADNETKVEIYSSGQALMRLRILKDQVCMSSFACMSKQEFNKKILASSNYPNTLLENIFNAKPIYNGKNLKKQNGGFSQNIATIKYKVVGKNISFIDSSNGVKIVVKGI